MRKRLFFKQIPWAWKEFALILMLILIFVPFFIEFLLNRYLTEFFQNDLYSGTLTGFIMALIFMIGVYFIALKPRELSWKEVGLNPFPKNYLLKTLGWTFFLIVSSFILSYIMEFLFQIGTDNSKTESIQRNLSSMNVLIAFVSAAVISPIYEEILYRGFLYRWLRVRLGVTPGVIISSIIFALVHIPTYNSLPYTFLAGMVFAWTYEKTESVYPAMIIHALFNGLAVLLTVLL